MRNLKITENRWKFVIIPAIIVVVGIIMYIVHGGFNFMKFILS